MLVWCVCTLRSLSNKMDELSALTCHQREYQLSSVLVITETWLNAEVLDTIAALDGFQLIRHDRTVDNGSKQERGLVEWSSSFSSSSSSYDLPLGMGMVRRTSWLRRFPISPSFRGFQGFDDPPPCEEEEEEDAGISQPSTKV